MAAQVSTKAEAVRAPVLHRWTRQQYDQMIEAGILDEDDRVELINGEIVTVSPQQSPHATGVTLVADELRLAYSRDYTVRTQLPLALDPDSEPEPDVAVVVGKPRDYLKAHPTTAILVVEVADTSLSKDRTEKVQLYARHGISEYWIQNVVDECLEVYRDPDPAGETYQTKLTLRRGDTITPPKGINAIEVADILP